MSPCSARPERVRLVSPLLCWAGCLVLLALVLTALPVKAGPPAPLDLTLTQPDGSTISARQWGDETLHGYETLDGYTIIQDTASGFWAYATRGPSGELVPARDAGGNLLLPGRADPSGLTQHLRPSTAAADLLAPNAAGAAANTAGAAIPTASGQGTQPVLVLLVEFQDRKHTFPASAFQAGLFGPQNSVTDFYRTASFGKLSLPPAQENYPTSGSNDGVIGWLTLPMNHPNTSFAPQVASAALKAADPYIDYHSYDTNGDGAISVSELHIVIVVAGYEYSYCGATCPGPSVWANHSTLDGSSAVNLDGVSLGSLYAGGGYAMFGEIHGTGGTSDHPATIGIMAHELGHDLNWPDLYDIGLPGALPLSAGVGEWSVMGSGSWNKAVNGLPGDSPALPDAFLKLYQGWISPGVGLNGRTLTIPAAEGAGYALMLGSNPNGEDWVYQKHSGIGEYWLVENRQQAGYDAGLPGCGLLIWHVDESVTDTNLANATRSHPLIELEQADGRRDLYYNTNRGDAGDPFPGITNQASFGTGTLANPSNWYYSGSASPYWLDQISAGCSSNMSARYHGLETMTTKIFLPAVANRFGQSLASYSGKVTRGGAPLAGATLRLMLSKDAGGSFSQAGEAVSGADGAYSFSNLPAVGGGQQFYVAYLNPGVSGLLGGFACRAVTGDSGDRSTCDMDLADIALTAPQDGVSAAPPVTFTWTPRASSPSDSYVLDFYDSAATPQLLAQTPELGYTGSFTLDWLPAEIFQAGPTYGWTARVITPDGVGFASQRRLIRFSNLGTPTAPSPLRIIK